MRHLLLLLLIVLTACATREPDPSAARFREARVAMTLDAPDLAPAAIVDSALFVQAELRPLLTSDEGLASIGVVAPSGQPLGAVVLASTQVTTIIEELDEQQRRRPTCAVITLRDRQPVTVSRGGAASLALTPTVVDGRRRIHLDVRSPQAALDLLVPDGAVELLREGGPVALVWTLVSVKAISLRDEDARRHMVDED